jgi:hypothetical protein
MKKLWPVFILIFVFSCSDEELPFTPSVEALYNNQFKVWSKTDIITDPSTGKIISENETRDLSLQYVLSSDNIRVSNDGGMNFSTFQESSVSLDSISYSVPGSGARISYVVLDVFRMKNGDPRTKNISNPRDDVYPELKGFYLFLQLENKRKVEQEGGILTEILLMYSEGYLE